jgi:hypothetical protein
VNGSSELAARQHVFGLTGVLLLGLFCRVVTWKHVFTGDSVVLSGPDAYYHLRRAFATLQNWPAVPQFDYFINAPVGGRISWTPLFDGLLATLALPWRAAPEVALERIGAYLPLVLGLLQIVVVFRLLKRLIDVEGALAGALVAAVLPGVVAYTRLGALDHDPLFELAVLLAIDAIVGAVQGGSFLPTAGQLAFAFVVSVLGFAGSPIGMAVVVLAFVGYCLGSREVECWYRGGRVLSMGATIAAFMVTPFVAASSWRAVEGATFEGLSLLQLACLVGVGFLGTISATLAKPLARSSWWRALAAAQFVVLALLLPESVAGLVAGARYAAGDALLLEGVAEGRSLFYLFGEFDLRPLQARMGLLPFIAVAAIPWWLWRGFHRPQVALLCGWLGVTCAVAWQHSRFTFSASLALAVFAGILWAKLRENQSFAVAILVGGLLLLPSGTAYFRVRGWEPFDFKGRVQLLERSGMDEVCRFLRGATTPGPTWRNPGVAPEHTVLAPWSFGHWIAWIGRQATVIGPMLTVGQSEFQRAVAFYVETDRASAAEVLNRYRVRYLVITPPLDTAIWTAKISGKDVSTFVQQDPATGADAILLPAAMRMMSAHLAYWGTEEKEIFGSHYPEISGLREVFRTSSLVPSPFGESVPQARVFEVLQAGV